MKSATHKNKLNQNEQELLKTVPQSYSGRGACVALGAVGEPVSRTTLYRMIKNGLINAYYIAGKLRVDVSEVERYRAEQKKKGVNADA